MPPNMHGRKYLTTVFFVLCWLFFCHFSFKSTRIIYSFKNILIYLSHPNISIFVEFTVWSSNNNHRPKNVHNGLAERTKEGKKEKCAITTAMHTYAHNIQTKCMSKYFTFVKRQQQVFGKIFIITIHNLLEVFCLLSSFYVMFQRRNPISSPNTLTHTHIANQIKTTNEQTTIMTAATKSLMRANSKLLNSI